MAYGFGDYPSEAPGSAFHEWDAVSQRRYNEAGRAKRASWDVPDGWGGSDAAPAPAVAPADPTASGGVTGWHGGGGTYASSGDPLLDFARNQAMADAGGRVRGARLAASGAVGADPSLSAYAGLDALISGQGDAAHDVNSGALSYALAEKKRRDEEAMMRLRYQLEEEAMRRANAGSWLGDLGQLAGTALGSYFGGPAGGDIGAKVGSVLG